MKRVKNTKIIGVLIIAILAVAIVSVTLLVKNKTSNHKYKEVNASITENMKFDSGVRVEVKSLKKEQLEFKENLMLEWNDGGHFSDISNRFKKAMLWLRGCK